MRNHILLLVVHLQVLFIVLVRQTSRCVVSPVNGLTLSNFVHSRAKACSLMKFGGVALRRLSHFELEAVINVKMSAKILGDLRVPTLLG